MEDYTPHEWHDGETISAERLNAIEKQLAELTKAVKAKRSTRKRATEVKEG